MRKILLSVLAILLCGGMYAEVLTPEQALQRILPGTSAKIKALTGIKPRLVATRNAGEIPAVYIFAPENGDGFAVVSADDRVTPLLGYSDYGTLNSNDINPTLQWWLDEYAKEVEWLRGVSQSGFGEDFVSPRFSLRAAESRKEILPMITSQWNQSAPYNNDCPRNGDAVCVTGCTATAMAQVVRYHHLPLSKNPGQASVTYNGETYTYDFDNASFDWDNMLDKYSTGKYTEEQAAAVADLMYACGVSVDTRYSPYESSAYDGTPAVALPKYFGFNKECICKLRDTYTLDTWIDMIYRQLTDYGPVIYSGQSSQGGHAFVCDGYSTDDYFHINWGWGGFGDGYFKLTALDPYMQYIDSGAYNYSSDQSAVVNICSPDVVFATTYSMRLTEPLAPVSSSTTSAENRQDITSVPLNQQFKLAGFPVNASNTEISGMVGYQLYNENNPAWVHKNYIQIFSNIAVNQGFPYLPVTLGSIADGDYRLIPLWMCFGGNNSDWLEYDIPVNNPHYINVHIENGVAYFSVPEHKLTAEVVSVDTPVFGGVECRFSLKVSNASDGEYSGKIHGVLTGEGAGVVAAGTEISFDLVPGETQEASYTTVFMPLSRAAMASGNYKLDFIDEQGRAVGEPYGLNVEETPEMGGKPELEGFDLAGNKASIYRNKLDFTTKVANKGGYFVGRVEVGIFDENLSASHAKISSRTLYLPDNQTADVKVSGSLPDLESGTKYAAVPYVTGMDGTMTQAGEPVMFIASDTETTTSLDVAYSNAEVISREIFNLHGIRIEPVCHLKGIYIVREKFADGTVSVSRRIFR